MVRQHPARALAEWFGIDVDWERRPADPRAVARHDLWLGLAFVALTVLGIEMARSVGSFAEDALPTWSLFAMAVAGALPLIWRRRYPLTVLAVVYLQFLVVGMIVPLVTAVVALQVAYFVALYTAVAWSRDRRAMLVVVSISLLAMFASLVWLFAVGSGLAGIAEQLGLEGEQPGIVSPVTAVVINTWIINAAYFFGAIVAGQTMWHNARRRERLAEQAATIEHQAAQLEKRAVTAERVRIARELHDVVAHHVSVIGIQAAAARRLLTRDPVAAETPLAVIESESAEAVEQMRSLVGTLRDTGAESPATGPGSRAPEPGLHDIATLAESDDGLEVTYTLVTEPPGASAQVPGPVGLSLYRAAQEALANVRRHSTARSARVTVRVDRRANPHDAQFRRGFAEVEVLDAGRARLGSSGSGLGMVGLRERVSTHRGVAEIGPRVTGGYRVRVRLPLPLDAS